MNTSFSAIATFNSCPKKYYFSHDLKIAPKAKEITTSTGRVIHEAFELYFRGASLQDCATYIRDAFDAALASTPNPYDHEDLTISKWVSLGMWENYPFGRISFDKVYPEQKFSVPVTPTCDLVGFLDGLVVEKGKYWVREVKTTGLNMFQARGRADTSYQVSAYIWAMQKILGVRVHGVQFDFIRKPLTRKNKRESAIDYAQRNYALYQDTKNHRNLYDRHYSYRSEHQIAEFEKDLLLTVGDIQRAEKSGKYKRWPGSCYMYGRECPYMKICWNKTLDQDLLDAYYEKRESRKDNGKTLTMEDNSLE